MYNAKNYNEQGGANTVIEGELLIKSGAKIKAEAGATVEGFGGGGEYVLPAATTTTLGGVKEGTAVADATSETVLTQLNALLSSLRTAGVIATE